MFQLIFTDCQFGLKYEEIFWSYPWFGVLLELSFVRCTFGVMLPGHTGLSVSLLRSYLNNFTYSQHL